MPQVGTQECLVFQSDTQKHYHSFEIEFVSTLYMQKSKLQSHFKVQGRYKVQSLSVEDEFRTLYNSAGDVGVVHILHKRGLLMSEGAVIGVQCEQDGAEHAALWDFCVEN